MFADVVSRLASTNRVRRRGVGHADHEDSPGPPAPGFGGDEPDRHGRDAGAEAGDLPAGEVGGLDRGATGGEERGGSGELQPGTAGGGHGTNIHPDRRRCGARLYAADSPGTVTSSPTTSST